MDSFCLYQLRLRSRLISNRRVERAGCEVLKASAMLGGEEDPPGLRGHWGLTLYYCTTVSKVSVALRVWAAAWWWWGEGLRAIMFDL